MVIGCVRYVRVVSNWGVAREVRQEMNIIKGIPQEAKPGQKVAIDTEFFGQVDGKLHRPHGDFAAMTINIENSEDVYLVQDQKDIQASLDAVKGGVWVMSNAVYDLTQLRRYVDIQPRYIWDTEIVERCSFGGLYDTFSLKDQARRWLDLYVEKETREEFSSERREMTPQMEEYAARDALTTMEVFKRQEEYLDGTRALEAYNLIDEPAIWPTLDMQPMRVDVGGWEKNVHGYMRIAEEIQSEIGVNVLSSQQVVKALAKNGIHVQNAQAGTLEEYADHEFVAKILEAKKYRKAISTYGLSWLEKYIEDGDLVYASWRVTGAETGRRSCSNPNLQQIPARKMPEYRDLFISKHGRMMVADVSAQEPRILAYHSQDPALLEALRNGEDVHQTVANAIHRDRGTGKIINLATSYGMTAHGLSKKLNITEQEATSLLNAYFTRFRGVLSYISLQRSVARRLGYVTTVSGRPVYMNPHDYQWENNAINAPIQGGAGDFSKMWERKIWEGCRSAGVPYSVCGLVHDEIIIDPPKEVYKITKQIEIEAFEQTAQTLFPGVPFLQEMKSGKKWSCKKLSEDELDEYEEE